MPYLSNKKTQQILTKIIQFIFSGALYIYFCKQCINHIIVDVNLCDFFFSFIQMNGNANGKISPDIIMNENSLHFPTNPECYSTRPIGKHVNSSAGWPPLPTTSNIY